MVLRGRDQSWRCDLQTYELREAVASSEPSLPRRNAPRPSRRTGEETSITFVNRTAAEVHVFWIDSEGERRPYGTVAAGQQRQQHTFDGHVWLITDAQGKNLVVFEAAAEPGEAIIDGAAQPEPEDDQRARSRRSRPQRNHRTAAGCLFSRSPTFGCARLKRARNSA